MTPLQLSPDHARIWAMVERSTSACPVQISELSAVTGFKARRIKAIAADLANAGLPIGSRRGAPSGYYRIATVEEAEESAKPLRSQALQMLRRYSKLVRPHVMAELAGQIRAEFEGEPAA